MLGIVESTLMNLIHQGTITSFSNLNMVSYDSSIPIISFTIHVANFDVVDFVIYINDAGFTLNHNINAYSI